MTPEELCALHPKLYHVTTPGYWPKISAMGLLPAARLVELFEPDMARRIELTTARRPREVPLHDPRYGTVFLSDNAPLRDSSLAACLEDNLTPRDWFAMLNARVFFWPTTAQVIRFVNARSNKNRGREVLVFDTLGLARAHVRRVEISPINSGATLHKPSRRGHDTFTPLLAKPYREWRRQRAKCNPDRIKEVIVNGGVPDIADHFIGFWTAASARDSPGQP